MSGYGWTKELGARVAGSRHLDRSKVQAPGVIRDPSGGYRLFYTAVGPGKPFPACQGYILSAHSHDGLSFTPDPGIRGAPDPEVTFGSLRLLAPTLTALPDGQWRMYFESRGPADAPHGHPQRHILRPAGMGVRRRHSPVGLRRDRGPQLR